MISNSPGCLQGTYQAKKNKHSEKYRVKCSMCWPQQVPQQDADEDMGQSGAQEEADRVVRMSCCSSGCDHPTQVMDETQTIIQEKEKKKKKKRCIM
jgi:hypothetical protein